MLRKFFIACFLLFAASTAVMAGEVRCDTNIWCQPNRDAEHIAPKATNVDTVCVILSQEKAGPVTLSFYNGTKLIRMVSRVKEAFDKICVGRHWVEKSTRLVICNEYDTRETKPEHLVALLKNGHINVELVR